MKAVFYNGIYSDFDTLSIPLTDRSIFFGDGVYDVIIGKGGGLYLKEAHLGRFYDNISKIGLTPYCEWEELEEIISRLISLSGYSEYTVYMQASGFSPSRTHQREPFPSNLLVTVSEYAPYEELSSVRLRTVKDLRGSICNIKTINLLPAVLASSECAFLGLDESVYVRDGIVTECSHSSVAIVKDGVLYTSPLSEKILPSVTRKRTLEICREHGIAYFERDFTKEELYRADEVLILSTTKLCMWAREVDLVRFERKKARLSEFLYSKLKKDYQNI